MVEVDKKTGMGVLAVAAHLQMIVIRDWQSIRLQFTQDYKFGCQICAKPSVTPTTSGQLFLILALATPTSSLKLM